MINWSKVTELSNGPGETESNTGSRHISTFAVDIENPFYEDRWPKLREALTQQEIVIGEYVQTKS